MSLLTRYLFRTLAITAGFAILSLTMTIWVTQAVRLIDMVVNAGAPAQVFFEMLLLSVPTAMTFYQGIKMPAADNCFLYRRSR